MKTFANSCKESWVKLARIKSPAILHLFPLQSQKNIDNFCTDFYVKILRLTFYRLKRLVEFHEHLFCPLKPFCRKSTLHAIFAFERTQTHTQFWVLIVNNLVVSCIFK